MAQETRRQKKGPEGDGAPTGQHIKTPQEISMQTNRTRDQDAAQMPNSGAAVETQRPTAAGRITRTRTIVWLDALLSISEERRVAIRQQAQTVGVAR